MISKWSDEEATQYCQRYASEGEDVALRVYTTRLLGRDPALVLHGGGNTSVKTTQKDELGNDLDVLCVKGSGWDMGEIEPAGLPALSLTPLLSLQTLDQLSDEDMVNVCRRNLRDTTSPNPSVEALLHAFLPHKFIDHTHADAVLALVNQPEGLRLCEQVWGARMAVVPYIMPGFQLSKAALAVYLAHPEVEGLILISHGIFTFGDSARIAYERMIEMVTLAEDYLKKVAKAPLPAWLPSAPNPEPASLYLPILRGSLVNHAESIGPVILHLRTSNHIEAWLKHERLAELAIGPITPDHIIRTKQKPLILEALGDEVGFRGHVVEALGAYVAEYQRYFQSQMETRGLQRKRLFALPVVFLIKGLGLVTMGTTLQAAKIAADVYEHTIETVLWAEQVGRFEPLSQDHLFDMEYWSLEQAKLGKQKAAPLQGRVCLISGAAGGIGAATAEAFATHGCNLVLTDLSVERLEALAERIRVKYKVGVSWMEADVTHPQQLKAVVQQAATCFGGLDLIVSNAGVAPNGPIDRANEQLAASLQINLMSHQFLASLATQLMIRQRLGGCLLFNASKSAFNPGPGFGAYSIAKAGLVALMKQYALEFAGQGIRAAAINADRIRTNLFDQDLLNQRARARGLEPDAYFKANLLGQEVTAADVALGFLHLYSSAKTTGAVLTVDGGNIAASPR